MKDTVMLEKEMSRKEFLGTIAGVAGLLVLGNLPSMKLPSGWKNDDTSYGKNTYGGNVAA